MRRWWESPEAELARYERARQVATRNRTRKLASQKASLEKFVREKMCPNHLPMGGRYPVRNRTPRTYTHPFVTEDVTLEEEIERHLAMLKKRTRAGVPMY